MAKRATLIIAAAAALALSACAGTELERTSHLTPTGSPFNQAMFGEYLNRAQIEYNEGDYRNSDLFALRAQSVNQGRVPDPQEVGERNLPADMVADFTNARGRLMAAIRGGARDRAPRHAAHAQMMFDCWLEEQEENRQPNDIAACRNGFESAMSNLGVVRAPVAQAAPLPAPAPQPESMVIYFDTDKSTLNAAAQQELNRIVARIRAINAKTITIVGYTDRVASVGYNMRLSHARADAVLTALRRAGVTARIDDSAFGEARQAVQTADGVAEAQNRRVEVHIAP